jgi:prolyl-tRNA editing enzyme YbaK/EbsC (Cys-tRNA(Pro) deacylase)
MDSNDKLLVKDAEEIIERENLNAEIIWHEKRGASTSEAEQSLGVTAADIAKTILFITKDQKPIMVIIMGDKRVDTNKLKKIIEKKVRIAKPDEVLEHTRHPVGGVTPLSCKDIPKFIDKSVLGMKTVFSSAGSPYASLKIDVDELLKTTKGKIVDVSE